jgi:hypothetical protein
MISRGSIGGFICLIIVFFSCEKEYEKHCERQGLPEQICKELRYENDVFIESVTYEYGNNDLVSLKLHENNKGTNIGQVIYTYDDQNKVLNEIYKNSEKKIIISNTWTYDDQQQVKSLISDVYGVKQESHFTYGDKFIQQEKIYISEVLKFNRVYEYIDNDTISYDVLTYDGDSVLLFINQCRRFDSSTTRVETYDASGELSGYCVQLFNDQVKLVEIREYDEDGDLLYIEEYNYENGVINEYKFLSSLKPNKKTLYLQF